MKFAGLVKNSFVDYPNQIACVVFTLGCNFNCWYCHNYKLIEKDNKLELIDEEYVLNFLLTRKSFLDGVVISGGEPTLHKGLKNFIKKVKKIGLKVKLDTNGTNPQLLEELLNEKLIDFVAMDIKTSLRKYEQVICVKTDIEKIKKSIQILKKQNIEYEFRTTFASGILLKDIENVAKLIKGAKSYIIQKYNPVQNEKNNKNDKITHTNDEFKKAKLVAEKYVKTTIRSLDFLI